MATKKYNHEYFTATVDGKEIEFHCWTTSNRNGFCHYCSTWEYGNSRCVYYNRTWERFRYESVLSAAIDKFPKAMREELREQIIERKAKKEHEEAEAFLGRFEKLYNGLNEENKKRMADFPTIQNESDARVAMGMMALMNVMQ